MSKKLGSLSCYALDKEDNAVWFYPGDELPDWAAKQMGDHVFDKGDGGADPSPSPSPSPKRPHPADSGDGPPPKAGAGGGRDAWAAYAESKGVEVADDAKRDHIIAELEKAGVPVE
jgi:hypothetical protein